MHPIYALYWSFFQNIFIFLAVSLTLLLVAAIFMNRKNDVKPLQAFLLWLPSLTTFITVICASFFSGILYDELNIPTDNLILFLMGYSTIIFLIHAVTLINSISRSRKTRVKV